MKIVDIEKIPSLGAACRPGLGIELDEEEILKYLPDGTELWS